MNSMKYMVSIEINRNSILQTRTFFDPPTPKDIELFQNGTLQDITKRRQHASVAANFYPPIKQH